MSGESLSKTSDPESIEDSSQLTVTTVEATEPYGCLPEETEEMLGWHITGSVSTRLGSRVVLLSDPFKGEPPMDEVIKVISHEYLHDILEEEIDREASNMLDNIVEAGNFLIEREENGRNGDRELKNEYKTESD